MLGWVDRGYFEHLTYYCAGLHRQIRGPFMELYQLRLEQPGHVEEEQKLEVHPALYWRLG